MKLRTRMILNMALVFALFAVALAVALTGMQNAKTRFQTYLDEDQELLLASTNMYAQGLQMGQALRNIVMDPANKQGYTNFENASTEFAKENQRALSLSEDNPAAQKLLKEVQSLRGQHRPIQEKIISMAAQDQPGALEAIRKDETPLWREIRARLQDFIKAERASAAEVKSTTMAYTQRMLIASIVLGLVAIGVGIALMSWLTHKVMQKLGGEPDYAARIAHDIAGGDLSGRVMVDASDHSSLLAAMRAMQDKLSATLDNIRHSANEIDIATREIASGNSDLSARTEAQAASLEETASSMEQLTSTVKLNADNAREASQLAVTASDVANKGGNIVDKVVDTMGSIKDSSRRMSDIIGVIDGIAFQTNILALNAAVEAARAGEQGRGFAVVAGEVRTLAQRSAAAAKEIKELIGDSVDKIDAGSHLVDDAGKTMKDIVESIERVTGIMGRIAAASDEQASGIEEINKAVTQMDDVTQRNAALVEQAAAATMSLQQQAHSLAEAVAQFKLAAAQTVLPSPALPHPAPVPARLENAAQRRAQVLPLRGPKQQSLPG